MLWSPNQNIPGKPGGVGHPGWWPKATRTVGSGLCRHNPVSGWGWSGGSPGTLASLLLPQEPRERPPWHPRGTPPPRSPRLPLRPPLLHPHPSPLTATGPRLYDPAAPPRVPRPALTAPANRPDSTGFDTTHPRQPSRAGAPRLFALRRHPTGATHRGAPSRTPCGPRPTHDPPAPRP